MASQELNVIVVVNYLKHFFSMFLFKGGTDFEGVCGAELHPRGVNQNK